MLNLPTYFEAIEYLERLCNYERLREFPTGTADFGTLRMEKLLEELDNPQSGFTVLHIAGTKGKGSTAYFTAKLLESLGLRSGLYISPHISDFRERIQLCGRNISQGEFVQSFLLVKEASERLPEDLQPTYFEFLTAIAFQAFYDFPIDVAVLEVGLGGRLDATNVPNLPVVASAITPVSHDHTNVLGETLAEIAAEKAGILRRETPLILGRQEDNVKVTILDIAKDKGVPVYEVGDHMSVVEHQPYEDIRRGQVVTLRTTRGEYKNVHIPIGGSYSRDNALVALGLIEAFLEASIEPATVSSAWKNLSIPGRLEVLKGSGWVILDGAHNPASAWVLSEYLNDFFPYKHPRTLVFSACMDKDVKSMLRILLPLFDSVVFTTNNSPRHIAPAKLALMAQELYPNVKHDVRDDPIVAADFAMHLCRDDGVAVVAGSFYLVGDVRQYCKDVCRRITIQ